MKFKMNMQQMQICLYPVRMFHHMMVITMTSFGITPETKPEIIEAAVTEQIVLEELTSEKIKYALTK